jgi:hypothetical protein
LAILVTCFSGGYMALMAWLYSGEKSNKYIFYILVGLFAGVFSTYFSHDSIAYQQLFSYFSTSPFSNTFNEIMRHELFFVISAKVLAFLPVWAFFCFYAVVSFAIKLALIEKVSRDSLLSLLCFFAFFFLYLDGTVVRVSLGIAVAYWGVYLLSQNRLLGFSLVILASSVLFHYSLLVLMVMPLFRTQLSIKVIWALTAVFFALYLVGFGLLDFFLWLATFLDTSFPGFKTLVSYLHQSQMSYPYSTIFLVLFVVCVITYLWWKDEISVFERIAFNMVFLSFLVLVVFYQSQAFQNRISEIFRYSLVFIAPLFYMVAVDVVKNPRWAMSLYCVFLGGYFIYYYYFKEIISERNLSVLNAFFFK